MPAVMRFLKFFLSYEALDRGGGGGGEGVVEPGRGGGGAQLSAYQ